MIVRNDKTKFEKFQNLLREANYKNIPTTKNECWKVDSFDLFQGHIKGKIKYAPDEIETLAEFVMIEKYYWTSVTMFPNLYLCYRDGETFKDVSDLTAEELETFKEQLKDMTEKVYSTPDNQYLSDEFIDIGARVITKLSSNEKER